MRGSWKSQLGFILASAGAAVGLGNVWRFPTVAANGGGSAFLLAFILMIILVGIPAMMAEMALGRHTARGPAGAFRLLAPGSRWPWLGYGAAVLNVIMMSYYLAISGACLAFAVRYAAAVVELTAPVAAPPPDATGSAVLTPGEAVFWLAVFLGAAVAIAALGVQKGLERTSTLLMPVLLILLVFLAIRVMFLDGAWEGVVWFFAPRWADLTMSTLFVALGQMYFSLSLGAGALITYASYLEKEGTDLPRSALWVVVCDTAVGIIAGATIIPALFAFDRPIVSGPDLVFGTLTGIFGELAFGQFAGFAFFLLLVIAALTSVLSMLEVPVAALVDEAGWPRSRAVLAVGLVTLLLGIPSALSMAGVTTFDVAGRSFIVAIDYVSSNILLPLGGVLTVVFVGWVWGAGAAHDELSRGAESFRTGRFWRFAIRYIVPVAIGAVLLSGIVPL